MIMGNGLSANGDAHAKSHLPVLFILCDEFLCLHIKQADSFKGIDLDLKKAWQEYGGIKNNTIC